MNIFSGMQPSAPSQRTAFDLNQRHLYSSKLGQDLPVLALDLLPNDYAEVDVLSLVRTLPINTSAYARIKARFQFIFVPYQQLWHGWNQFFLQQQELMSTGTSFDTTNVPCYDLDDILNQLFIDCAIFEGEMNGAWDTELGIDDDTEEAKKRHRMENLIDEWYADEMGFATYENALRMLDLLGYGSHYGICQGIKRAMLQAAKAGVPWDDYLLSVRNLYTPYLQDYDNRAVNIWRFLAYQKAWQDYFMNKRVQQYDPTWFNVDDFQGGMNSQIFFRFFHINYHPWPYDMFTGLYESPQDGDVSLISGTNSFSIKADQYSHSRLLNTPPYQLLNPLTINVDGKIANPQSLSGSGSFSNPNLNFRLDPNTGISVYDIKRAEYLQHWKENKLRAGYKLQNQAQAQWNTRFKYLSDEYSEYIDEVIMNVSIDEVVNTAENQGDISGKGIGTQNGHLKFKTEDAGVLLCICSVTPSCEYNAAMLDKQNTCIEPWDYPSPFFDKLGFEPIYMSELNISNIWDANQGNPNLDTVLGYGPRYAPWKSAIDKVHGLFQSSGFMNPATYQHEGQWNGGDTFSFTRTSGGSLSAWSMPRYNLDNWQLESNIYPNIYYVNPSTADTIFAAVADSSQETDQFLFNTNFVIKVVRQLSGLGLPNWQ